eukprot:g363.t1
MGMFNEVSHLGEKTSHLQMDAFDKMLTLLQDAGYYRAGNSNLKMFDKIIGGLCWSISASGANVDVDILFEEDMPLGKKVTLSENVVKSLERMKCPHPLKAHQIQGLDFAALLPIIRWAVKGVAAFRGENSRRIRLYTHHHFEKHHSWPESFERDIAFMHELDNTYRARRVLKRPKELWSRLENCTESELLQTCLLEFGRTVKMDMEVSMEDADDQERVGVDSLKKKGSAFDSKVTDVFKKEAEEEAIEAKRSEEQEKELLKVLAETAADKEGNLKGKDVGSLIMQGAGAISSAAAWYEEETKLLKKEMEGREELTHGGRMAAFKRRKVGIERQIAKEEEKGKVIKEKYNNAASQMEKLNKQLEKTKEYSAQKQLEMKELEKTENKDEFAADFKKLRHLVMLNENLKSQEKAFKSGCKKQMAELQAKIEALKGGDSNDEETARLAEIEEMHAEVQAKYDKGKLLLANKARDIATLQRKIDEVPLRSELIQYERRFVELYDLIAAKLDETRKYFSTYNMLAQQRDFLQKEVDIIQSINDNFLLAMKSKKGKEQFAKSCAAILDGIKKQTSAKGKQLDTLQKRTDDLSAEYGKLVEKQRLYFKLVRDFQDACDLNEKLLEDSTG